MNVLITGANGFVGSALCKASLKNGWHPKGALWKLDKQKGLPEGTKSVEIDSIGPDTHWEEALQETDCVIHLAARVHVMNDTEKDPLQTYRLVNTEGTRHLAEEAARMGVKRFVYISTVKVNGEENDRPYQETNTPDPKDPYGVSKWEAEQALMKISRDSGMEIVNIRPPLVYGPGVRANFLNLLKLVNKGIPLPMGCVNNRRSLVFLGNFVDGILKCAEHPKAVGETFLISDGDDKSTRELIILLANIMDKKIWIVPVPVSLLMLGGKILGKSAVISRLVDSLMLDVSKIKSTLDWKPPFSMEKGLKQTITWFKSNQN